MSWARPQTAPMLLNGWSISHNALTFEGQADLLKQLGTQMQNDYAQVMTEPLPNSLQRLLDEMDQPSSTSDGHARKTDSAHLRAVD